MRNSPSGKREIAFTLVEMLAVLVLTALLAIAAFRLMAALSRDTRSALTAGQTIDTGIWLDTLREDLQAARSLSITPSDAAAPTSFTLTGLASLSPDGGRSLFPAKVTYAIETIAARPWLVRRQQALGDRVTAAATRELVLPDVTAFNIAATADASKDAAMPRQLRITLTRGSSTTEQTLTLR